MPLPAKIKIDSCLLTGYMYTTVAIDDQKLLKEALPVWEQLEEAECRYKLAIGALFKKDIGDEIIKYMRKCNIKEGTWVEINGTLYSYYKEERGYALKEQF